MKSYKLVISTVLLLLMMLTFIPLDVLASEINADELEVGAGLFMESDAENLSGLDVNMVKNNFYYHPENYSKVLVIGNLEYNTGSETIEKYFLIFYEEDLTIDNAQIKGNFLVKDYYSLDILNEDLFAGANEIISFAKIDGGSYLGSLASYQVIVSDEYEMIYTEQQKPYTLNEYHELYLNNNSSNENENNTSNDKDDLKYIFNYFKWFSGTFLMEEAGELINEKCEDNEFFTSVVAIKNTLQDLYNEDYSSRTGFYELGLLELKSDYATNTRYKNHGNSIIGDWEQGFTYVETTKIGKDEFVINWGFDDVQVLNFDWFFGKDLGDGYYTKGLKPTTDKFISAFLWLGFAWALYLNLPNVISGELTSIGSLITGGFGSETVYNDNVSKDDEEKVFNTQIVDNNTGEILRDTTTIMKKGKGWK